MICAILKALKNKNIINTANLSDYDYFFNNRANINLFLYSKQERKPLFFIKISNLRNFETTFNNMQKVYNILPHILPEPTDFFCFNKYQILVTKAYNLDLLITKSHFNSNERRLLLQSVMGKIKDLQLRTVDGYLKFDKEFCQEKILPEGDKYIERWGDYHLKQQFRSYLEKLSKYFGVTIPRIPQHGDLVMLNTGLLEGKVDRVIFIDWDSYSAVELPMFDLLIFLTTFVNFYGENMYMKSELSEYIKKLFFDYCKTLGLDVNFVIDLYPICLILFASLKADIGVYAGQEFAINEIKRFLRQKEQFVLHP